MLDGLVDLPSISIPGVQELETQGGCVSWYVFENSLQTRWCIPDFAINDVSGGERVLVAISYWSFVMMKCMIGWTWWGSDSNLLGLDEGGQSMRIII